MSGERKWKTHRWRANAQSFKPIADREAHFWASVDRDGGPTQPHMTTPCWPWIGTKKRGGYGQCWDGTKVRGAHRAAYAYAHAVPPIRPDVMVLHSCDHPPCCNPAHLRLGDQDANMADKMARGRQARGPGHAALLGEVAPRGESAPAHKLTEVEALSVHERAAGGESTGSIAASLGVTTACIRDILRGHTWSHLAPARSRSADSLRGLWVTYQGERHRLLDLCERVGVSSERVRGRMRKGWTLERAIETAVRIRARGEAA